MELSKAIRLIRPAAERFSRTGSWVDLGSGTGLFTRALSFLLPPGSTVHAVDTSGDALGQLKPVDHIILSRIQADFLVDVLPLSELDGILMANALHFVPDKTGFITKSREWLVEDGCYIIIEYDTDTPNKWVPYPVSFASLANVFAPAGYKNIIKIGTASSLYQQAGMYAALVER